MKSLLHQLVVFAIWDLCCLCYTAWLSYFYYRKLVASAKYFYYKRSGLPQQVISIIWNLDCFQLQKTWLPILYGTLVSVAIGFWLPLLCKTFVASVNREIFVTLVGRLHYMGLLLLYCLCYIKLSCFYSIYNVLCRHSIWDLFLLLYYFYYIHLFQINLA